VFTARYGLDIYTQFKLISVYEGPMTGSEPQINVLLMYTKSQGRAMSGVPSCQMFLNSLTQNKQTKQQLRKMWLCLTQQQQPHVR